MPGLGGLHPWTRQQRRDFKEENATSSLVVPGSLQSNALRRVRVGEGRTTGSRLDQSAGLGT